MATLRQLGITRMQKAACQMVHQEGLEPGDAARRIGLTRTALHMRRYRARLALKRTKNPKYIALANSLKLRPLRRVKALSHQSYDP